MNECTDMAPGLLLRQVRLLWLEFDPEACRVVAPINGRLKALKIRRLSLSGAARKTVCSSGILRLTHFMWLLSAN